MTFDPGFFFSIHDCACVCFKCVCFLFVFLFCFSPPSKLYLSLPELQVAAQGLYRPDGFSRSDTHPRKKVFNFIDSVFSFFLIDKRRWEPVSFYFTIIERIHQCSVRSLPCKKQKNEKNISDVCHFVFSCNCFANRTDSSF